MKGVNQGIASFSSFRDALQEAGYEPDIVSKIFCNLDVGRDGSFDYADFLGRAITAKGYMVEVKLAEAFDSMESNDGRNITKAQIMNLIGSSTFVALGIDDIFDGATKDIPISFHDFLHLFDRHIESLQDIQTSERSEYIPAVWGRK